MSAPRRAVVLVSGGLDSATTLALAREAGFTCYALSVDYGQRHAAELDAARRVALALGAVEHRVMSLDLRAVGGSALTDSRIDVPTTPTEGIPVTYVPARNTLMLSLALGWAEVLGAEDIHLGVNAVDYSGYPDCRPAFIEAFERLANVATRAGVEGAGFRIHAPLLQLTKADIIREALRLGVDLASTVSCYAADDEGRACGQCESCRLRREGFAAAGVPDPTRYLQPDQSGCRAEARPTGRPSGRVPVDSAAMPLITLRDAELAYGLAPLLNGCNAVIDNGERVALIGRNGTGKSSLLGVFAGRVTLDAGECVRHGATSVVYVEQEPELPEAHTLLEAVMHRGGLEAMDDDRRRWRVQARLGAEFDRFGLSPEAPLAGASGGERKRAALALAFALEPDLLLLDEPTNHLDIAAIEVLEARTRETPACVLVTHDRRFLDAIATRILELDRGVLRSYPGSFAAWQARKEQELADEAAAAERFDQLLAEEEVWIRQGIKARRTRNEGRVRRLEDLRRQRAERRERIGQVNLNVAAGERSGRIVAEFSKVTKRFGERCVVDALDFTLSRGDRLGLIGPNGAGKSTLIRLLLGEMPPDEGNVRLGTKLEVAYFDQLRAQLDVERTVAQNISPGADWVEVNGSRRHVMSYLGDFLFSPQRARTPVKALSGGERNRLLLARLLAKPANLLVLDEPTNDLDLETLELLEAMLGEYTGTLVLVSHDRSFLDAVVTQSLVAQGEGRWVEIAGGYSDWLAWRDARAAGEGTGAGQRGAGRSATGQPGGITATTKPADPVAGTPAAAAQTRAAERPRKLSFKEARELEALPARIEQLEAEQDALAGQLQSDLGADAARRTREISARLEAIATELDHCIERWTELEARST